MNPVKNGMKNITRMGKKRELKMGGMSLAEKIMKSFSRMGKKRDWKLHGIKMEERNTPNVTKMEN